MPLWRSARNLLVPTSSGALAFWAVGLLAASINLWDVAEQWRDRIQGSRMSTDHFDFIVVGAGTAGSVVASRLSEKYSVLLLEAGGKPFPATKIPAATLHIQRHKAHDWNFRARRSGEACLACEHGEQTVSAGKMLGGSSALGFNIWSRGHFKDYDAWRDLTGDSRWSYKELSGFFEKAEKQFSGGAAETESRSRLRLVRGRSASSEGGEIRVPDNGLFKRPAEVFLEAAASLSNNSTTKLDYRSAEFGQDFGMAYYPMANGRRLSAYDAYVKPVRRNRPDKLTVVKYAEVSKILFEPGSSSKKAIGVEYTRHGRSHQMFAMKEVVLSAGALQSPRLLMLSGIGPRQHLEDLKIPVLVDAPGVGGNLQDFESTYIGPFISKKGTTKNSVLIDRDIKPRDLLNWASRGVGTLTNPGIPALGYFKSNSTSSSSINSQPDIQYLLNSCAVHSEWSKTFSNAYGIRKPVLDQYVSEAMRQDSFFVLTSVLRPRRRGQIRLRTSSPAGPLDIQLHSLEDVEDLKVAVEGTKAIVKLIETSPAYQRLQTCLTRTQLPSCAKFKSDQYWECYWRHLTISRHNYVGTCSMGPSDAAVVDSELRVKGVRDLRVIDASVAPLLPTSGTYAMAVMIGERGAKFLLDDWRSGSRPSDKPVVGDKVPPEAAPAPKPIEMSSPKTPRFLAGAIGNDLPAEGSGSSLKPTHPSHNMKPSVDQVESSTEMPSSSLYMMVGDDPNAGSGHDVDSKPTSTSTSATTSTTPSTPSIPEATDYEDQGTDFVDLGVDKPGSNGHSPSVIHYENKTGLPKSTDYTEDFPRNDDVSDPDEQLPETTVTPNQQPTKAENENNVTESTGYGLSSGVSDVQVKNMSDTDTGVYGGVATTLPPLAPKVTTTSPKGPRKSKGPVKSNSDKNDIDWRVPGNITQEESATSTEISTTEKTEEGNTEAADPKLPEAGLQETPQETTDANPTNAPSEDGLEISESGSGLIGGLTSNSGSDFVHGSTTTVASVLFEIKEGEGTSTPAFSTPAASLERSENKSSTSPDFSVTCVSNTVELHGTTLPSLFEEPLPQTTPKVGPQVTDPANIPKSLFDATKTSKASKETTKTSKPKVNKDSRDDIETTTVSVEQISQVDQASSEHPPTVNQVKIITTTIEQEDTTTIPSDKATTKFPLVSSSRINGGRSFEASNVVGPAETLGFSSTSGPNSDFVGEGETTEAVSREAVESQPQLNESAQETTEPPSEAHNVDFQNLSIVEDETTKDVQETTTRTSNSETPTVIPATSKTSGGPSSPRNGKPADVTSSAVEVTTDVPPTTVLNAGFSEETSTSKTTSRPNFKDMDVKPRYKTSMPDEDDSSLSSEECSSCSVQSPEKKNTSEGSQDFGFTTIKPNTEVPATTMTPELATVDQMTTVMFETKNQAPTTKPTLENSSRGPKFINVSKVHGLNQLEDPKDSKVSGTTTSHPAPDGASRRLPPIMPEKVHDFVSLIHEIHATLKPENPRETSTMLPEGDDSASDEETRIVTEDLAQTTTSTADLNSEVIIKETTLTPKFPPIVTVVEPKAPNNNTSDAPKAQDNLTATIPEGVTQQVNITTSLPRNFLSETSVNRLPLIRPEDVHNFLLQRQNKSISFLNETMSQRPLLPEEDVHQRYLGSQSSSLAPINFSAYHGEQMDAKLLEVSEGPSVESGVSSNVYGSLLLVFFGIIVSTANWGLLF